jgi:hypothetical protein
MWADLMSSELATTQRLVEAMPRMVSQMMTMIAHSSASSTCFSFFTTVLVSFNVRDRLRRSCTGRSEYSQSVPLSKAGLLGTCSHKCGHCD